MSHDLGDRPDPTVAGVGRWRLLFGDRRPSRATTVAPVDGTKREWQLAKQAWDAEQLLNRALILVDEMLPNAKDPQHIDDLLDLQNLLTGKAK